MSTRTASSGTKRGRTGADGGFPGRTPLAAVAVAAVGCLLLLTGCPANLSPVYGDGSAGDVTVTTDAEFTELDPDGNLQFHNLTVNVGVTLTVPSGGVIRCTGSFVNHGTVLAGPGGAGGYYGGVDVPDIAPDPGISRREAGAGATGPASDGVSGGGGGLGVDVNEAEFILDVAPGGGGGGCADNAWGGVGGGGMLILAGVSVSNTGTIRADGASGPAGGGGGGIIILASPGSVSNTGVISAAGANGANAVWSWGGSGGGGGGIVHFMSPVLDTSHGQVLVGGGAGGAGGTIIVSPRTGGGGGGASGGNGGHGGSINQHPSNVAYAGDNGDAGYVIESLTDPTAWFK